MYSKRLFSFCSIFRIHLFDISIYSNSSESKRDFILEFNIDEA